MHFRLISSSPDTSVSKTGSLPRLVPVAIIFVGLLLLRACSSSNPGPTTGSENTANVDAVDSEGLGTSYIWVDSTKAVLRSSTGEELTFIGSGGEVVFSSSAPSGAAIVYAANRGGRIELNYVDVASGASRILHVGRAPLVYTSAWSPDEQYFAFGYYASVEGAGRMTIGEGEIMILNRGTGNIQKAGCSSAQAVISWPSAETLLVRNNDNMYGVSPADCATQKTVDIRKWHHLTPSPDGLALAYILRDLAYNTDSREYEADSMLYIVPAGEEGGELVVGDRYRPRNMAWSADNSELAFDVLEKIGEEKRVIFIYQVAENRRFVLNDPSPLNPSESHPSYLGADQTVYYLSGGEFLTAGSGAQSAALQFENIPGKPVGIVHLPASSTHLVEFDSGDVYQYWKQTKNISLIGRGTAIIPNRQNTDSSR